MSSEYKIFLDNKPLSFKLVCHECNKEITSANADEHIECGYLDAYEKHCYLKANIEYSDNIHRN